MSRSIDLLSRSMMDFDLLDRVEEESTREAADEYWETGSRSARRPKTLFSDKDAVVSPFAIRNLTETEIVI